MYSLSGSASEHISIKENTKFISKCRLYTSKFSKKLKMIVRHCGKALLCSYDVHLQGRLQKGTEGTEGRLLESEPLNPFMNGSFIGLSYTQFINKEIIYYFI